ncbi:MAG: NUDIX hydrolase [Nocardioides sp.]
MSVRGAASGARPPWERLGEDRVAYAGFLRVLNRTLRLPDGRRVDWDLLDIPSTVTVLPLTPAGVVVCVRQYRPGPNRYVVSLPGGLVDSSEDPLAAAGRELREETGYVAAKLEFIGGTFPNSATNPRLVVVARDCVAAHDQELDEFEDCEVVLLTLTELRAELKSGRLGSTEQTYLALDHLQLL